MAKNVNKAQDSALDLIANLNKELANITEEKSSLTFLLQLLTSQKHTLLSQVKILEDTVQTLTAEMQKLKRHQPGPAQEMQSEEKKQLINTISLVLALLKGNKLGASLLIAILKQATPKHVEYKYNNQFSLGNTCRDKKPFDTVINNNTIASTT